VAGHAGPGLDSVGARRRPADLELNAVVEWARPRGFGAVEWYAWQARGLAALGRGDFEEAYQQACRISPPGTLASHVPHALAVLMDVVEAAVRTGRHDEAAAHVAAMQEANLAGISSRLALVVGASAAMAASDDTASELFEAALALPEIERWQFDLARVRLAYGERLRRRRAMVAARVQLNAALEIFERLRARPWMDRASAEVRATGQTKPHAGGSVLSRLGSDLQRYACAGERQACGCRNLSPYASSHSRWDPRPLCCLAVITAILHCYRGLGSSA
jgi:hypothetical protein